MTMRRKRLLPALAAGALVALTADAQPSERSELQALRAEVDRLQGLVTELARRLDEKERATAAVEPGEVSQAQADSRRALGVSESAVRSIRLRGLLNVDARAFVGDDAEAGAESLLLRRARLIADGELGRATSFQFTTEFGGNAVAMLDANASVAFSEALVLKVGKFKTPIGLEVLQGAGATSFAERSLVSTLLPNRDLGVQVGGATQDRRVDYAVGVFNGTPGGTHAGNSDVDTHRQLAGRVMMRPFASGAGSGLSVGVGGSGGDHETIAARSPGHRSEGQRVIFSYLPTVTADGEVWRLVPHLDFRRGAAGLMAEHVTAQIGLRANTTAPRIKVRHQGWQVTGSYLVTGEASTYGQVAPRNEFDPAQGSWGAVEVLARYAEIDFDNAAFPTLATPGASPSRAESLTLGLKWYWSRATMVSLNYVTARFGLDGAAPFALPASFLRSGERVLVSRFQLAF